MHHGPEPERLDHSMVLDNCYPVRKLLLTKDGPPFRVEPIQNAYIRLLSDDPGDDPRLPIEGKNLRRRWWNTIVHDLQSVLSSNVPPSCDEATSLKQLLQQEESTFSALFKDISHLQAHLNALIERHRESQLKVQQYQAALSSARVLPPELVRRIFVHCVEEPPVTWRPSPGCLPLSLTQICSGWRQVALATPELWSNINLSANTPKGVQKVKELAELWFDRCRAGPISLAFATKCQPERILNPLYEVVAPNSERIGTLELHLPTPLFSALAEYCHGAFPLLHSLQIHGTPIDHLEEGGYRFWNPESSPFQLAQRLTDVVISIPKTRINLECVNLPWSQLSSLHLAESIISPDMMLRVLDRCSSLTACSARLFANNEITAPSDIIITLPSLKSFSLYMEAGELNQFLRYISFPAIQTIALHVVPNGAWDPGSLIRLVSRSQCRLVRLSISGSTLAPDDFIDLLRAIPTIQELDMMFISFLTDDILGRMSFMTAYEDPPVPLLRALKWKEVSLRCSPGSVRRFIATRGWPVNGCISMVEGTGHRQQKIQRLERLVISSKVGHFGSEWGEQLLEFKDRGLDLSYEMH